MKTGIAIDLFAATQPNLMDAMEPTKNSPCPRKPMNTKLIVLSTIACGLFTMVNAARAKVWTLIGADTNLQSDAIACSAYGNRLAATIFGGGIYISTNAGNTWNLSGAPSTNTYWGQNRVVGRWNEAGGGGSFRRPRFWFGGWRHNLDVQLCIRAAIGFPGLIRRWWTRLIAGSLFERALHLDQYRGSRGARPACPWHRLELASRPRPMEPSSRRRRTKPSSRRSIRAPPGRCLARPPNQYWSSIASSADGRRLIAEVAPMLLG